jgi:hypothetical protein
MNEQGSDHGLDMDRVDQRMQSELERSARENARVIAAPEAANEPGRDYPEPDPPPSL